MDERISSDVEQKDYVERRKTPNGSIAYTFYFLETPLSVNAHKSHRYRVEYVLSEANDPFRGENIEEFDILNVITTILEVVKEKHDNFDAEYHLDVAKRQIIAIRLRELEEQEKREAERQAQRPIIELFSKHLPDSLFSSL